jgi:hypothetical protein
MGQSRIVGNVKEKKGKERGRGNRLLSHPLFVLLFLWLSGAFSELGRASSSVVAGRRKMSLIKNLATRYKKQSHDVEIDSVASLPFVPFFISSSPFVHFFFPILTSSLRPCRSSSG